MTNNPAVIAIPIRVQNQKSSQLGTEPPEMSFDAPGFRRRTSNILTPSGRQQDAPRHAEPTRSAPTSAAVVKMPPPSRAKTEIREPPKPRPTSASTVFLLETPASRRTP